MTSDRSVERGPRRREWCGHRSPAARATDGAGQDIGCRGHHLCHLHRLGQAGDDASGEQLGVGRRTRLPLVLRCALDRWRVRLEAAQVGDRVRARDPVDGRVVHLGEHRDLAGLQALDHEELPQRPRAVQRDAGEVAAQVRQLAVTTRRGHRHPVHVPVDVEVVVDHPHRVVDPQGHLLELAVEHRDVGDPALELVTELIEVVAASGDRLRVQDDHPAHVQQLRRGLQVEEAGVESTEAFHVRSVGRFL